MAVAYRNGPKIVFGVPELKPIKTTIEGKQRLKLRAKSIAEIYIKTADGIRKFNLADNGDHWEPIYERGRNARPATFPITTKAEQEEITVRSAVSDKEIRFMKKATGLIHVQVGGQEIVVRPLALLAAVRVICGEQNKN